MQEFEIQKYLRTGKSLEDLKTEHFIDYNVHPTLPLVSLNYNQIASNMALKLCQECRGLILELDTWNVAARSFNKFFNYEETNAVEVHKVFDWNSLLVSEKVDGSLILVFHYNNEWQIASRGMPDAGGPVSSFEMTFKELVQATMREMNFDINSLNANYSYAFELTTPLNQVVVPYESYNLTWIGCWDLATLDEIPIWSLPDIAAEKVRVMPFKTIDEIMAACEILTIADGEGFVIMDKNFHRLKLKAPQYVMAARAINYSSSPRHRMDIILSDKYDDIVGKLPDFLKERMEELKSKFDQLVSHTVSVYNDIKDKETQKDFALEAVKYPFSGWLFQLRKGTALSDVIKNSRADAVLAILEKE